MTNFKANEKIQLTYEAEIADYDDGNRIWEPLIQGCIKNKKLVSVEKIQPSLPKRDGAVVKISNSGKSHTYIYDEAECLWRDRKGREMISPDPGPWETVEILFEGENYD